MTPTRQKPDLPPNFKELFQEVVASHQGARRVLGARLAPIVDGRYIHWHKLQYLKPPKGFSSHKEWWLAIKHARFGQFRMVPLEDSGKRSFGFTMPDPALEYLHHVDQNAGGRIEILDREAVDPKTQERFLIHSLTEEAITSSQLEGSTTTRKVAKEMIRNDRKPRDKSEQMIMNNYHTMRLIRDRISQPLTKELIFELHRMLVDKTLDDPSAAGRFRNADEDVRVYENDTDGGAILHTPPSAGELEARIQKMCDFANGKTQEFFIHPVVRSIILHFWLAFVHPFVDGNGRCARALFYWSMMKQGYWLCEYLSISQIIRKGPSKYGRAYLYTENDDNDLTYFILYHLSILERAIKELHQYIEEQRQSVQQTEAALKESSHEINHRQMALLSHALRHPEAEYTIKAHMNTNQIVYETARTDLDELVNMGFLERRKRGVAFNFYPVQDLAHKLKVSRAEQA